eukprot:XP_001704777.1 Hypothetical protein GL50803_19808 [Giardia lamblia ATCC 50803]
MRAVTAPEAFKDSAARSAEGRSRVESHYRCRTTKYVVYCSSSLVRKLSTSPLLIPTKLWMTQADAGTTFMILSESARQRTCPVSSPRVLRVNFLQRCTLYSLQRHSTISAYCFSSQSDARKQILARFLSKYLKT